MQLTTSGVKLWGIGVGPGASDLITLRALDLAKKTPVLAIPQSNAWTPSLAWKIIAPHLPEESEQIRLRLTFPMTKDPEILKPAWEKACQQIGEHLIAGRSVAFITQGDPMIYSTFHYLADEVRRRWPEVGIESVPAVSSISAAPGCVGIPLADGQERIAVIPATYGVDDLRQILRMFDSIVLMKVSSQIDTILAAIRAEGLLDKAYYIERATTTQQKIVWDLETLEQDRCIYFSMIIVTKKDRSGILQGRHTQTETSTQGATV
ncbi:MAG: precorrin-2 C(20)-methyltransferase [Oligoflexus sp.]